MSTILAQYFFYVVAAIVVFGGLGAFFVYNFEIRLKEDPKKKKNKESRRQALRFIHDNRHGEIDPDK